MLAVLPKFLSNDDIAKLSTAEKKSNDAVISWELKQAPQIYALLDALKDNLDTLFLLRWQYECHKANPEWAAKPRMSTLDNEMILGLLCRMANVASGETDPFVGLEELFNLLSGVSIKQQE